MFSDKSFEPVSVPSYWENLKSSEETSTQTADTVGHDKSEQTTCTTNVEVQTDNPEKLQKSTKADENALASFLTRICPKVMDELDKASKSKAFQNYALPDEDSNKDIRSIHTLIRPKNHVDNNVKVNSLAWSCTGGVIVLAVGLDTHEDWCSHNGFIYFYNINRSTTATIVPSKILEAPSCVTTVATHPYEPSILACGLYRGNIILWNLQKEGAECIATVIGHSDPVTHISWFSSHSTKPQLVSAGLDGRINFWNASHLQESITLIEKCELTNNADASLEAGITCFSFSSTRPGVFVAALEGGKIFHCCINNAKSTTRAGCEVLLKNPIISELKGHRGMVTCISFSPYHEDTFISVGTDQEIHVHSIFQMEPTKVIWCENEVIGVAWSPSQANVFISWGQSSEITIYDSKKGCKLSSFKINDLSTLSAASFNWKSPKLLAAGDINGKGCVYQIPQHFDTC